MNTIKRRARGAGAIVVGALITVAGVVAAVGTAGSVATHPMAVATVGHGLVSPAPAHGGAADDGGPVAARSTTVGLVATGVHPRPPGSAPRRLGPGSGPSRRPGPPSYAALSPARLLAGVGQLPAGWVASAHDISVDGLPRVYLTIEPGHITTSIPVVVLLHGRDMSPDGVLRISDLANRIGPAVLVVPAGWEEFWNAGDCCGAAYLHHIDDVAFIHAALDSVVAAVPAVASSQVYAVGFSNGGRLAYHLACDLPGVFTGVMAVEAVPVEACRSMRPLDVTVVAQQADPLLTVNAGARPKTIGGFVEPTVAATIRQLAALDHCRSTPVAAVLGLAVERSWSCGSGTQLRYVWYPGGSHSWRSPTGATPGATDFVRQLLGRGDPAGDFSGPGPMGTPA